MSWAPDQVFEFYSTPHRQQIAGNVWQDVLEIPAEDLEPWHSYAIVVTGQHGHYWPTVRTGIKNAGELWLTYGGSYVADTLHRFDVEFGEMHGKSHPEMAHSFTILAQVSTGSVPQDLVIQARCDDAGIYPSSSFELDGVGLQIYDQTTWSGTRYLATALSGTLKTANDPSLSPLLNLSSDLTHGSPAKKWLLWYSIVLQAEDTQLVAGSWMTQQTSQPGIGEVFDTRSSSSAKGSWLGYLPRGRVGYWHRHHVGSGRVLEVDQAGVRPTLWAADLASSTKPSKALAAKILAIPLDDISDELHTEYSGTPLGIGSWAPSDNPDWWTTGVETEFFDTLRVLSVARAAMTSGSNVPVSSFYTALELDSGRLDPALPPMRTKYRSAKECQAMHRLGRSRVDAGKHCVRHLLWCDSDEAAAGYTRIYDRQILVLSTAKGYGISRPPVELIGPELVLVPGEESVDVTSLPSLPIEPNLPSSWEELDPAFELKTPTGYVVSWPLSLEPRRRGDLRWTGLPASDKDLLLAWLRSRKDTGAAFAFQPPDTQTPRPFVLDGKSIRWAQQPGDHFEVTIGAIELRYTGV